MSLLKQMSQSYEYSFNPEMTENKQSDFYSEMHCSGCDNYSGGLCLFFMLRIIYF